jgi:hypothetical protein
MCAQYHIRVSIQQGDLPTLRGSGYHLYLTRGSVISGRISNKELAPYAIFTPTKEGGETKFGLFFSLEDYEEGASVPSHIPTFPLDLAHHDSTGVQFRDGTWSITG